MNNNLRNYLKLYFNFCINNIIYFMSNEKKVINVIGGNTSIDPDEIITTTDVSMGHNLIVVNDVGIGNNCF